MTGTSLTRIPGAEIVRHNGEEGVFIPIHGNLERVVRKDGVVDYFLNIAFSPSHRGKFSYKGYLRPPKEFRDQAISEPLKTRRTVVAWMINRLMDSMPKNKE